MGRLRFSGHICRMNFTSLMFRILNYKPIGVRTRVRPKLRWADCVEDFIVLKVTKWRTVAKQRSEWKRVLGSGVTYTLASQGTQRQCYGFAIL
ncbi:hypothetical protein TNCV_2722461 [Trichonephila clavipes]|nr:hypothetical protein TNCV_2722461 [Trichonephila clavipes]